jgi:aquaporin Z
MPSLPQKLAAEFVGTFWLVFGGCGSAVLAAVVMTSGNAPVQIGIGLVGVSLAFGLTVLTMAYAVGHISWGHFNPAVTAGLTAAGRFWAAQTAGAIAAAFFLFAIASGNGFTITDGPGAFATNGYGALSPKGYDLVSAALTEFAMTFFFLVVILGVTSARAPAGFAPLAIGLALTLIHLISIPVTNTSVNPARSTGVALVHLPALSQLWLFWVMPIVGGVVAGLFSRWLQGTDRT